MPSRRSMNILFPMAGLNRQAGYRQQPPYSSADLMNVRPRASIQGRARGGSRPGLVQSHVDNLVSPVRLLTSMALNLGDGFTSFSDNFVGSVMSDSWSLPSWGSSLPLILPGALASIDTSVDDGEAVLDALPIDTAQPYTVEAFLAPWDGEWHGEYRLYLRLDNTTPDRDNDGVVVELTMTGSTGAYTATLDSYTGGVKTEIDSITDTLGGPIPGWLSVTVSGNDVTVYWGNAAILSGTVDAHTGSRLGFGLTCTVDGGLCLVNTFRVQYYSTGTVDSLRTMLFASAGGDLYREGPYGRMTVVTSDLTVRDDVQLTAAQSGQKLYIADYGDVRATATDGTISGSDLDSATYPDWTTLGIDTDSDVCVLSNVGGATVAGTYRIASVEAGSVTLASAPGDGTASFRIERAPKVYDPFTDTISIHTATAGQVPTGNPLVCNYLDRIVYAGAEIAPHVWYMSRKGDPDDWDYAEADSMAAVAGTASDAGMPGEAITALVPHRDDYLIFGCRNSIWRMRGDPAYGGILDAVSRVVGIIGRNAWCLGPAGELIFLSLDGIYVLPPGGDADPIPVSRDVLPREMHNLDPHDLSASLEYDVHDRGVHIFLTAGAASSQSHWWLDWPTKTFWPASFEGDYEPTATCAYQSVVIEDSGVILGGRDGVLRRFSEHAETDCGTSFETYALFGPIPLGADGQNGAIISMDAVLAENSGDVTWATQVSTTFEGSITADASDSGTWTAGLNATNYPAARGQAFCLLVTGETGRRWAFEQTTIVVREAGRRRLV